MAGLVQMYGSVLASSSASLRGFSLPQKQQQPARRCSSSVVRVVAEDSKFALNPTIQKESDKVTDTVSIGDLSKPTTAYCRCWRSGTFPLCDGTHAKYNKSTGDNVGPLLLKK